FVDAADHFAIGEHIIVLVRPVTGRAGELGALEDVLGHRPVMTITKSRIWVPPGETVHRGGESVASVWPHQRRMVRADLDGEDDEHQRGAAANDVNDGRCNSAARAYHRRS